jgi:hypothetical protein
VSDADELKLVRQAIISRVTGDSERDDRAARRVRRDRQLEGLTPEGIKSLCQGFVANGGAVKQKKEKRPEYSHRRFYYTVIIPLDEFLHGLFIEIELTDEDALTPAVRIVNAHEQKR